MTDERNAVDLTEILDRLDDLELQRDDEYPYSYMLPAWRDEIVLALRVLRVLRHPKRPIVWVEPTGEITTADQVGIGGLDAAERLFGLAKEEPR